MKCDRCNGRGTQGEIYVDVIEVFVHGQFIRVPGMTRSNICPKCFGKADIDWLENVIGVDIKYDM
jgi:hypothetical protein